MCSRTDEAGQVTVEAAFLVPVLFVVLLLLLQPGILLYDRIVMQGAAAQGCRLLVTSTHAGGSSPVTCEDVVKRSLGAIPPHDLFHVHEPSCTWEITCEGDEYAGEVAVSIRTKVRPLPLFDAVAALAGAVDGAGYLTVDVRETARTQPAWTQAAGVDPGAWATARG